MSSTNELISMNVDLVKLYFGKIKFPFLKASEYCSERQKLHSNFLTSRRSGHVRFEEKPGWGIHIYAYLVFIIQLCEKNFITDPV